MKYATIQQLYYTVAHNCHPTYLAYIKLKYIHIKFKLLTSNSNSLTSNSNLLELFEGPGSAMGYCAIWHTLELEGIRVPRVIVQDLFKEMDPEAAECQKCHRLKRRVYHNPGLNYSWRIDGYDKLKCWGFPVEGSCGFA
jgi:hypothetical protein